MCSPVFVFRWLQVEPFLVRIDKWDLKATWSHIKKASPLSFSHAFPTRSGNSIFTSEKSSVSTLEECDLRKFSLADVQGNGTRSWSRSGSHGCERQLNNWCRDVRGIFIFTGIWCQLHAVDQRCRQLFSLTLLP